jgi:DNA-binding IclR family transcriptional regulator
MLLHFTEAKPVATIDDLADAAETSVSSAYRYLALLREMALVEERSRGQYVLSARTLALSRAATASMTIAEVSRPILRDLSAETHETAALVQRIRDTAVCVESSLADRPVRLSYMPGDLFPMHRGAAAKVLLAHLSPSRRRAHLSRLSATLNESESARLAEELVLIRSAGYAQSDSEVDEDVWAVAAPVRESGAVVAAVTVSAPTYRVDAAQRSAIVESVVVAADAITQRLSH